MSAVGLFLVALAGIFLVGTLGEVVFKKTKVPDVLWLIVVGIGLGPATGIVTRERLGRIAPYFAALTLIIILFEGGSRLKLKGVSRTVPRAALLALTTFLLSVAILAPATMLAKVFGILPPTWSWLHGLLLGAILGGSSSIVIMPSMAQAHVESEVADLVGLESAVTDALCVVGASALIGVAIASGGGSPWLALLQSFGIGLGLGAGAGVLWIFLLRLVAHSEHAYPVTLAALFLLYVGIDAAGGSAAMGILSFAILVGNAEILGSHLGLKRAVSLGPDVRGVHSQIAFFVKSFFFTFIGAMLGPPWGLLGLGAVFAILLLAARVPGVMLLTIGSGLNRDQKEVVAVSLPRGMAAGVLATLPAASGMTGTERLPTIVFACVLATILIFAIGFPVARRRRSVSPEVGREPKPDAI